MRTLGFTVSIVLAVILLAAFYSGPAAGQAKLDGKAIFLAQKCNMCHSVSTAAIEATTKSEKMKGPDLVNLKQDAKALTDYLMKKSDLNGKKHTKGFTGSEEELKALIAWMLEQKK